MKGRIYISGAFTTVSRSKCGGGKGWMDNDPHFWEQPPTWGICRTDYRRVLQEGDYIFFVLPKKSQLPQMVYGYFKIQEKISHLEAFHRPDLRANRMGNKNPNGNIIVDAKGYYNKYDKGVHRSRFEEIRQYYVIGDGEESEFLSEDKIKRLAPDFLDMLNKIFETDKSLIYGVISRGGRRMTAEQVNTLLTWIKSG